MSDLRRVRIDLAYDGTGYVGLQRQANGLSIQQVVEEIFERMAGFKVTLFASGRTDAGVHALCQPCHADLPVRLEDREILGALNAMLPGDIAALSVATVAPDWNARHDATRKTYRYLIHNNRIPDPFLRHRAWSVFSPLDSDAMKQAAPRFLGQRDFSSLQAVRNNAVTSVRRILRLDVDRQGDHIVIETTGTGFLKHMVRNMVGMLVEVGLGKRDPAWVTAVLDACDRTRAARCAPPQGLYMVGVGYDGPRHNEMDDD